MYKLLKIDQFTIFANNINTNNTQIIFTYTNPSFNTIYVAYIFVKYIKELMNHMQKLVKNN